MCLTCVVGDAGVVVPVRLLVDKKGLLAQKSFPSQPFTPASQRAFLRHLLSWFWRNVPQCATALARNHLWTAHSYLEQLRCACVNLVRLQVDPSHWPAGYEKLERVASEDRLDRLHMTFVSLERMAFSQALATYVSFYREHAIPHYWRRYPLHEVYRFGENLS